MAKGVRVDIDDRLIISALNEKGRPVQSWTEASGRQILKRARELTPVNNPLNAIHRGGRVGEMKRSWRITNTGANGHRTRSTVYNTAGHAYLIEYGRQRSYGFEVFTWQHAAYQRPPGKRPTQGAVTVGRTGRWERYEMGQWVFAERGTGGYEAQHPLARAANMVMPGRTRGSYTPLPTT